ncbi:hypothetical protein VH567_09425 [Sphingomonas sp. 4RDLI-65]|uniref:hypothetical protein n=1 Tax=Sphingomonas sp. 4RDLI-65 TaxID=3111641 RepID=UPI003C16A5E7
MTKPVPKAWDGAIVRTWLASRVAAARSDQVVAERAGWGQQDACDVATAEEMVCTMFQAKPSTDDPKALTEDLRALLDRDEYVCRGVYDDTRFDRHVRAYIRKLIKMVKTNDGFEKTGRYQ